MASLASGESAEAGSHRMSQERSEDGGRWYFSRKEIEEHSPSRSDGIDLKKEAYLRKSYCTFLQDLGMRLKVPQVTIATAIIFCHRFFLRQSHAKNDRRTVATACMFLGGKVEETPRPLKDVIIVSYEIIHKKDPAAAQKIKQKEVYEQQKELILVGERLVLATLGFDLNVQHPYKPLVEAIKKFKVAQNALAQVAWNFVNDGLRTSLCLQFMSHHIAAGAIFLAAKFLKVKLPSDGDKVWWQEFDVTPRQLEEVSNQMLELYEQNKALPSHGSEAEGSVAGGAANRAASKTVTENHLPNGNSSQGGATADQLPDYSDKLEGPPRSSQSKSNDCGSSDHKFHEDPKDREPLVHQESLEEIQNVGGNRIKDGEQAKDKFHTNIESKEAAPTQSPFETIEKIDTNKLKELREKRKKSRGDVIRKKDSMDEFDPILKELEEGVELAAAESKQEKRHVGLKGQRLHGLESGNAEEGEVSTLDNPSWDNHSPESNDHKRKAGSPEDIPTNSKRWRDSVSGELSEENGMIDRVGYLDRDKKRHQ
ncbi:cyclin-T1-3-like [Silene latifolia]|uniref:cyclin-T1-3-like n=1 Tax=Silene latifolia TaxID=37657 RepID=UPI003D76B575